VPNTESRFAAVAGLDGLRSRRPALGSAVDEYHAFLSTVVDPVVLSLCRLRMAQIASGVDAAVEATPALREAGVTDGQTRDLAVWRRSDEFDAMHKSCLEYAEQFYLSAESVTDDQVARVRDHLSAEQTLGLTMALWLSDSSTRLSNFLGSLGAAPVSP
jgi:alkylhydroperoxidase family enzyme